ncbi:olfactory receptor 5AR1-like [Hyperolius riggenbachi]|uniref:olfactory receptor 5AR1-like n=1 Tax=Hyperolius riggenbachi TaxID=752182 RepID=UPI0035A2D9A5
MSHMNQTKVNTFVLSGLTDDEQLIPFLFTFFLIVYLVCVVFNFGIIFAVLTAPTLRTPMYHFLAYLSMSLSTLLSMVDIVYSSAVTPKMLADLTTKLKLISFEGCAIQFFFFDFLVVTEALLISTMAYDRYAAICHPLHYVSVMTNKKCLGLIVFAFSVGFLHSIAQTSCVFSLDFCGPNYIEHFFCDVSPLLKLVCSSSLRCNLMTLFIAISCGMGSMAMISVSYSFIVFSILQIKSTEGRKKAFNTCSSHLICVSLFYGTVFFIYLRPPAKVLEKQDKAASIVYTVLLPMMNPLIYSLRNQEVKRVIRGSVNKCLRCS